MKLNRWIGIMILCVSITCLWGCAGSAAGQNGNTQPSAGGSGQAAGSVTGNGGSGQNAGNGTSAGSQSGQSGKTTAGSSSNQTGNSQQNNGSGGSNGTGTGAASNNSGGQSGTHGSTGAAKSNKAPKTHQAALHDAAAAIDTRVPLMLPAKVPAAQGKYLTATTKSETWYYSAQLYAADKPAEINSNEAAGGSLIATVEGTEYKDSAAAQKAVKGYIKADTSQNLTINLGHGIKALAEGAMGHAYITWNEGRWSIKMDSPNSPDYKTAKYKDTKRLAENMVSYLNDYALPAPQRIGVINVSTWKNNLKTTVQWQYHEMTYQVTSKDPLVALKVAVAMQFASH